MAITQQGWRAGKSGGGGGAGTWAATLLLGADSGGTDANMTTTDKITFGGVSSISYNGVNKTIIDSGNQLVSFEGSGSVQWLNASTALGLGESPSTVERFRTTIGGGTFRSAHRLDVSHDGTGTWQGLQVRSTTPKTDVGVSATWGVNASLSGVASAGTHEYIGVRASVSGGTSNYSVQLQDGTEALGYVLSSVTADGKSNWVNPNTLVNTNITDDVIPRGTGTTIEDGTWTNVGNDLIPVTDGSNIGSATKGVGTLFMSSIIDYKSNLSFLNSASIKMTLTTGGELGIGSAPDASSILSVTSTTLGFLTPRMTTLQRDAIATPAESLIVYDTDLNTHTYNHPVDGHIPIGRYSGEVNAGGSATNGQVQMANLDGEIKAGNIRVSGNQVMPLNTSGVQTNNAVSIGTAGTRFNSIYSSSIYVSLNTVGFAFTGSGTSSRMIASVGTGGGIRMQSGTGKVNAKFCVTANKGVILTDTTIAANTETAAHVALELGGNGMMNYPNRVGSTIEALASFGALPDGTVVNIGTGDGAIFNAVGLWFKKAGTWTFIA
jgi:hypothetical protein